MVNHHFFALSFFLSLGYYIVPICNPSQLFEGAGEMHTNEKTKTTRYVHTARQAAFDSQSLPPARHLPYAKDWPDPVGVGEN